MADRHENPLPEKLHEPVGDGAAVGEDGDLPETYLILLKETAAQQSALGQEIANLSGQGAFVRQQMAQMYEAVRQLYDAVGAQCRQLLQSDQALREELQRFQTGGPQRAMAGVFHKLFRDLVRYVHELDKILDLADDYQPPESEMAWLRTVRVARDHFEALLKDWGCTPVAVDIGQEEFNPEIHEAAPAELGMTHEGVPEHVIVKVIRRGWMLHGQILVPPLVVVS